MKINVLDHGYVEIVETWGSDERIIEAARMSTDKGFQGWGPNDCPECIVAGIPPKEDYLGPGSLTAPEYINICKRCKGSGKVPGDEKLLSYLYEHKHMTPFEMGGLIIEVQAPIFVFREWHRHRTQSFNELSSRYTQLPDLYYIPSLERMMAAKQSTTNKQSSDAGFTQGHAQIIQGTLMGAYAEARKTYEALLAMGVAREVARLVVPVSQYSRMRASANLRNWLQFLALRLDKAAQFEIRMYAEAVATILRECFPRTMTLFNESR
jgi:thymidylate synthase (FAD)